MGGNQDKPGFSFHSELIFLFSTAARQCFSQFTQVLAICSSHTSLMSSQQSAPAVNLVCLVFGKSVRFATIFYDLLVRQRLGGKAIHVASKEGAFWPKIIFQIKILNL